MFVFPSDSQAISSPFEGLSAHPLQKQPLLSSQSGHTFLDLTPWHTHACLALVFIPACTHMCPQRTHVKLFPLGFLCRLLCLSAASSHVGDDDQVHRGSVGVTWAVLEAASVKVHFWGEAIHVFVSSEGLFHLFSASWFHPKVPVASCFLHLLRCDPFHV